MQMNGKLSKKFLHVLLCIFAFIRLLGFAVLGRRMWCGPLASQSLGAHEVSFCQTEDKTYHLLPTPPFPSAGQSMAEQPQVRLRLRCHQCPRMSWEALPLTVSTNVPGPGNWLETQSCWAGPSWCGCSWCSSSTAYRHIRIPSQGSLLACSQHTHWQGAILSSHPIVSFPWNTCWQTARLVGLICVSIPRHFATSWGLWLHPFLPSPWQNQKGEKNPNIKILKNIR